MGFIVRSFFFLYYTVEVLTDLILPATEDSSHQPQPGAKDAGVAEFIDFMVYSDPSIQARISRGHRLAGQGKQASCGFCRPRCGPTKCVRSNVSLTRRSIAKAKRAGQQFFALFRKNTVMGFYTSRVGLESLDYPGLKLYSESPGCTHEGNPEHIGL